MNPKIYRGALDAGVIANQLQSLLGKDGFTVRGIAAPDGQYVQIRKEGSAKTFGSVLTSSHNMVFTVRLERNGSNTVVSLGETRWADGTVSGATVFYPLLNPNSNPVYFQYRLQDRVINTIDSYAASLTAPVPSQNPTSVPTANVPPRTWELSVVQSEMSSRLKVSGSVDLAQLAKESSNNLGAVEWIAEKMVASSSDYILTMDKQKILTRNLVKSKIGEWLNGSTNIPTTASSSSGIRYCSKCGRAIRQGDRFCQNCGARIS